MERDRYSKEFEFEDRRCQNYFDYMYKTLEFSFAAIIAVVGIAFGFFSESNHETTAYASVMFQYVLPICLYVFGVMYVFNAYALAACGERAELLHKKIYSDLDYKTEEADILKKYVNTNRVISLISYGVPLGFYLVIPLASILYGIVYCKPIHNIPIYNILAIILLSVYYIIMVVIIVMIIKPFFATNKIQREYLTETREQLHAETGLSQTK